MKKALLSALGLVLVLALTTGCGLLFGGKPEAPTASRAQRGDTSATPRPANSGGGELVDWPTAQLPPGLPKYPGGTINIFDVDDDGSVLLGIRDTDESAYNAYVTTLQESGWVRTRTEDGLVELTKDGFQIGVSDLGNGQVIISVAGRQ